MKKNYFFNRVIRPGIWQILLIILVGVLAFYWIDKMCMKKQIELTLKMAKSANYFANHLLREKGSIVLNDTIIYAGSTQLNYDKEIVDKVKSTLGFGCTIFLENKRIATTAVAKGGNDRALGTRANTMVTKLVYENGGEFLGVTNTIGKDWVINYTPLYSEKGVRIGMLATYIELNSFLSSMLSFRIFVGFTLGALCSILSILVFLAQRWNKYLTLQSKSIVQKNIELEKKSNALKTALSKERELGIMKSHFVSVASHQFRTPLSVIFSNFQLINLILKKNKSQIIKEIEPSTERIRREIRHMTELMDDVLILGKFSAGKTEVEKEEINLVNFCEAIVQQFNDLQKDKRRIEYKVEGKEKKIYADSKMIRHSVINLISNAFKYSKKNPLLTLFFKESKAELAVQDFGVGIPEEDLIKLFEPFHRGANVKNIQGTGLGLAIAKDYVVANGGTINVESSLNVGTTFTITLPITSDSKMLHHT